MIYKPCALFLSKLFVFLFEKKKWNEMVRYYVIVIFFVDKRKKKHFSQFCHIDFMSMLAWLLLTKFEWGKKFNKI